jgi:hypothetical protein
MNKLLARTRVSFDYDGVLSTPEGKRLAKNALADGYEVLILTARRKSEAQSVYNVADRIGISRANVIFTEGMDKYTFVMKHHIGTHYDNSKEQVDKINARAPHAKGILFKQEDYA